ncbi:MAG: transcriptional activator NhaR [Gammaproteobacteria bacterium]|nr:transcriptional activator NhaR [Gammaproteobacteria bacterium]
MNYKHLYYFYVVAREGSLLRASDRLNLTPQTVSGQLKVFEETIGNKLFRKSGRKLVLTDQGNKVLDYAEDIFSIGQQLENALHTGVTDKPSEFRVGVADVIPKSIAFKFLLPTLSSGESTKLVCHEFDLVKLMAELAVHELDMVIADCPMPANIDVRAYNHVLGSSDIEFFAAPGLIAKLKGEFPRCMDRHPLLLPGPSAAIRQPVLGWLEYNSIFPVIIGEFDDTALLKAFGSEGIGIFFAPSVIGNEICRQFNVQSIGITSEVKQDFYAISVERKISHSSVKIVTESARDILL